MTAISGRNRGQARSHRFVAASRRGGWLAAAFMVAGVAGTALAESLTDPTRQPPGYAQGAADGAGQGASAAAAGVAMVVIAPDGRSAVVDGQAVRRGSRLDRGVVLRIDAEAVHLRRDDGQVDRLPVYPGVTVRPAAAQAPNRGGAAVRQERQGGR
ncbi:MAG: hypothetical protein HY778_04060 [Betaproteobacteria bacterium]|nr:hypothetical protein [Betaproteobacteria bacterium]